MSETLVLKSIQQAKSLARDILQAIEEGDTEKANSLSNERLHAIQTTDFSGLIPPLSSKLERSIEEFKEENKKLTEISNSIKSSIYEELKKLKVSKNASNIYYDINNQ